MSLTTRIVFDIQAAQTGALDLETPASTLSYRKVWDFADGSGANQANKKFSDTRTLGASGTEDLDMAGVLVGGLPAAAITFTRVVAIAVFAAAANTNNVVVTCPVANGFITPFVAASDGQTVRPGGFWLAIAPNATGFAVTAGTGDLLTITNSAGGTSVSYDVVIIGS